SAIGKRGSPKMPMPKVVVQTIVRATMKAAAAANNGRHRAASHNSKGKSAATGTTVTQDCRGKKITTPLNTARVASATSPSTISRRGGGSRAHEISPIKTGAVVMIPSASDANQWYQIVRAGVASA